MGENNMEFVVEFDKISKIYGNETLNDIQSNLDEVIENDLSLLEDLQ